MSKRWFVSEPCSKKKVTGSEGSSKEEAQKEFLLHRSMLTGENKPWVWWEKQGYRMRKA